MGLIRVVRKALAGLNPRAAPDERDRPGRRRMLLAAVGLLAVGAVYLNWPAPAASLSGRVTPYDESRARGTVTVTTADGQAFSAGVAADGQYHFDQLPTGPVTVEVTLRAGRPTGKGAAPQKGRPQGAASAKSAVAVSAGHATTLVGGANTFDIAIK